MIKSDEYKLITDNLGASQADGLFMLQEIISMGNNLDDNELSTVNLEKQILQRSITDTYRIIVGSHVNLSQELRTLVGSIQKHVLKHYSNVNIFLQDNNIKVTNDFADLSALCGYTIDLENIE